MTKDQKDHFLPDTLKELLCSLGCSYNSLSDSQTLTPPVLILIPPVQHIIRTLFPAQITTSTTYIPLLQYLPKPLSAPSTYIHPQSLPNPPLSLHTPPSSSPPPSSLFVTTRQSHVIASHPALPLPMEMDPMFGPQPGGGGGGDLCVRE